MRAEYRSQLDAQQFFKAIAMQTLFLDWFEPEPLRFDIACFGWLHDEAGVSEPLRNMNTRVSFMKDTARNRNCGYSVVPIKKCCEPICLLSHLATPCETPKA